MEQAKNCPKIWRKRKCLDSSVNPSKICLLETHLNQPFVTIVENLSELLSLPNEILIYIMKYLDSRSIINFSKSCLRCYSLGYDSTIWRKVKIEIQFFNRHFFNSWEQSYIIGSRWYCIRCLHLTGAQSSKLIGQFIFQNLKFQKLSRFMQSMRNVTTVILECFALEEDISMIGDFPNIQYLEFSHVYFSSHFFRKFNLTLLFPLLHTLVFHLCPKLIFQNLSFLVSHLNLTKLYVDSCYRLSQTDMVMFVKSHPTLNQRCKCFHDGEQIIIDCFTFGGEDDL